MTRKSLGNDSEMTQKSLKNHSESLGNHSEITQKSLGNHRNLLKMNFKFFYKVDRKHSETLGNARNLVEIWSETLGNTRNRSEPLRTARFRSETVGEGKVLPYPSGGKSFFPFLFIFGVQIK